MRQQDVFASSQILVYNPILKENTVIKVQYYRYLRRLTRMVRWEKRKYTKAQLAYYETVLCGEGTDSDVSHDMMIPPRMFCLLPYDLTIILSYQAKVIRPEKRTAIIDRIVSDFKLPPAAFGFLSREFDAALGDEEAWDEVLSSNEVRGFKRYLQKVKTNILFIKQDPYNILFTATMSAGKSTLINALVGTNISKMQTTACTGKIHKIVSKPWDDGLSSEFDGALSLNATNDELMMDNEANLTDSIIVGTYFRSALAGQRVVLLDSPGVNYSGNEKHREISYKVIRSKKYKLLLYVMNATQLRTDDEADHLKKVRQYLGRAKILFVMNVIDELDPEEENLSGFIDRQRQYLCSMGFTNPIICPVSARAAFLAKKKSGGEDLDRISTREMDNHIDKCKLLGLTDYYEKALHCSVIPDSKNDEAESLLKTCGFAYFEQLFTKFINGG